MLSVSLHLFDHLFQALGNCTKILPLSPRVTTLFVGGVLQPTVLILLLLSEHDLDWLLLLREEILKSHLKNDSPLSRLGT